MNDIQARETKKAKSSELSKRLRKQRPMFKAMLEEEHARQQERLNAIFHGEKYGK